MSGGTSCAADTIGHTLEDLMRSLASMTGNLMGGDTLASCGAAEASDRLNGLPFRASGARSDSVSKDIRRETKRRRRVQDGAFFILARRGIQSACYYARWIALA